MSTPKADVPIGAPTIGRTALMNTALMNTAADR